MRSPPYLLLALLLVLGAPRPGPAQAAPDAATPSARKPAVNKPAVGKHESTPPPGGRAGDARGTPELATLRDRLDRLARDPKAGTTESLRLSITHTVDVADLFDLRQAEALLGGERRIVLRCERFLQLFQRSEQLP